MTTLSHVGRRSSAAVVSEARIHVDVVIGEHDEAASLDLRRRLAWVADEPRRAMTVDLARLDPSQAPTLFALLAATAGRARAIGNRLVVTNVSDELRPFLRSAGLKPS